jgi:hypothetical protein
MWHVVQTTHTSKQFQRGTTHMLLPKHPPLVTDCSHIHEECPKCNLLHITHKPFLKQQSCNHQNSSSLSGDLLSKSGGPPSNTPRPWFTCCCKQKVTSYSYGWLENRKEVITYQRRSFFSESQSSFQ